MTIKIIEELNFKLFKYFIIIKNNICDPIIDKVNGKTLNVITLEAVRVIFKLVLSNFKFKKKIKIFNKTKKTTNISTLVSFDIQTINGVEKKIEVANKLALLFINNFNKKKKVNDDNIKKINENILPFSEV
tara:strand:- start:813 stop:1205 length:393 start_codon:yes stop_codon:yes gene_type:complete